MRRTFPLPRLSLLALLVTSLLPLSAQTFSDGPAAAQGLPPLPVVAVQGNRFVNEAGQTVVFRGLALSDPYALQERGQWSRRYFETARSWNANLVRIPVHPEFWRRLGETAYLELLDQGVQWANELGMYVIIDWHTIGNPLTDVYHRPIYITNRGETFRFWHTIASRYARHPGVAFYELFNEPTNVNGRMGRLPWSEYRAYLEEIIYMIRQINPRAIPLVSGFDWAYELRSVREDPVSFPGVAYVSHPYPQKRNPPWEPQWQADWGYVAEKYPVFCTEFGFMSADGRGAHVPVIGDETYGEALVAFMEERGISWTPWVLDAQWSPQLIEDWNFTPTRQGRFFREKLHQLNQGVDAPRR
jgi:endoglucanase